MVEDQHPRHPRLCQRRPHSRADRQAVAAMRAAQAQAGGCEIGATGGGSDPPARGRQSQRQDDRTSRRQIAMKRTISTLAILGTFILSAKAGETPSRADMFKSLLVVGVYSRLCATPLSEYAKAQTLT